jgi:hypothetical protein
MSNIFYTTSSFIVAVLFVLTGIICMSLPWLPEVHTSILRFLIEHTLFISLIGLLMLISGVAALSYIIINSSKRTFYVKKGTYSVGVDRKVLEGYLEQYLKDLSPSEDVPHQLIIRKRRILISTDFPYKPKPEQEPLAEKIYDDLVQLLEEKFGCKKDLYLSISFQSAPKDEAI